MLFLLFPAALVEFENNTYVVNEGVGYHQICLNSSGYDFYANFSATYHDNDNFTEGIELLLTLLLFSLSNFVFHVCMFNHSKIYYLPVVIFTILQ